MHLADLNWLAVVVSTVAFFALGAIWYSSALFGKVWAAEMGIDMENPPESNVVKTMGGGFVLELIAAIVVGMVMMEMGEGLMVGIHTGLLLGLGIASVLMGVNYLFEQRSLKFWLINAGHMTIGLAIVGAIQGVWQ
ncbi:MAG: DUF1761 domain-containing protein [Holophagales bacterium]|nr:DUF1761 domain-containing protein [Holophagales bacterium]MYC10553.1 DUF1761 domain-containing protein [Holophagales bacterium]